jgi:hypothetical protein
MSGETSDLVNEGTAMSSKNDPPAPDSPKPAQDPLVEAEIQRALAPYVALLSPDALAIMRDVLEDALTTHPVAVKLLDHIRERPEQDTSGVVVKEGAEPASDEPKAGGGEGPA